MPQTQKVDSYRFAVFKQNYLFVKQHNADFTAGKYKYTVELNKFAILTPNEFSALYLMQTPPENADPSKIKQLEELNLPEKIDWRDYGINKPSEKPAPLRLGLSLQRHHCNWGSRGNKGQKSLPIWAGGAGLFEGLKEPGMPRWVAAVLLKLHHR